MPTETTAFLRLSDRPKSDSQDTLPISGQTQTTPKPYHWPTEAELESALPDRTLQQEMLDEKVRTATAAFAAGAEYVSLTMGDREVGRIYSDGRHWSPPL